MEEQQYRKIIDTIPTFSGEPHDNVHEWLDTVSLKFDIIGYNPLQKRRFIAQYLSGNALKWHLTHRDALLAWDEYIQAIAAGFPHPITTSRDMNLKLLRDRKQGPAESFIEYYTSMVDLCRKHDPQMANVQIIDWLKAGMKLNLYERLQGEEFNTPQALLVRAQRVELANAVLDARKRESAGSSSAVSNTSTLGFNRSKDFASSTYHSSQTTPFHVSSYPPPPLMGISYSAPFSPPSSSTPNFHSPFPSPLSSYPSGSPPVLDP